ncbi:MAG: substrate-binding domain-containing protein [Verrucomicrobiota bacterium]|jgi:simple sugar transport system substrate-binding protein
MKAKDMRTIGAILAMMVAVGGIAVVISSQAQDKPGSERALKIAFITPFSDIPFFGPVKKGVADAAKQLNMQCDFKGPAGGDAEAQIVMIRQAVAQGYEGIAVNIIDSAKLAPVIDEVIKAGIPVVAFNCDDKTVPTKRLSAICQDVYEAGRKLGKTVAPSISDGSTVFITLHDEGVSALEARKKGIVDGLKGKNLKFETIVAGSRDNAIKVVTERLKEHPEVKTVLCTGQSDTEGVGLAIERGFSGKGFLVAGFDLSEETLRLIKRGTIRFAIDQQPYVQGYYPAVQLAQYCRYGIMPSDVDAGAGLVTQEIVDRIVQLCKQHYR